MAYPTDRPGYVHGMLVEFRHVDTDELLWESSVQALPRKGDVVWYAVGAGALTDYDVKFVRWEFRKLTQDDTQGDPQEVVTALSDGLAVVRVKEAP